MNTSLPPKLEEFSQRSSGGAIRVNEIRFVAEDSAYSDARIAAQLTARTLGADADAIQEWFRSPEKMIQLIAAAEGASKSAGASGSAGGTGAGSGSGAIGIFGAGGPAAGNLPATGSVDASAGIVLNEADMQGLLRLLAQFGEATQSHSPHLDASAWQQKLSHLPQNAQVTLRQALAGIAGSAPKAKLCLLYTSRCV